MVSDKQWESNEISMWVNNDESLHELARQSESSNDFFDVLEMIGVYQIGGIKITPQNVRESWEDAKMTNDSRELTHAEMQTVYEQNLKDFQRLQRKALVLEILNEMDVPDMRKDLNKIGNLRWLQRNLLIRNGNHPRAVEVVETITKMARDKNKENQKVMKLPIIPGG